MLSFQEFLDTRLNEAVMKNITFAYDRGTLSMTVKTRSHIVDYFGNNKRKIENAVVEYCEQEGLDDNDARSALYNVFSEMRHDPRNPKFESTNGQCTLTMKL